MSRKKKILAWTGAVTAVVLLAAGVGGYVVYQHLNHNLRQVNISGELGSQPVNLHPQAENIVIIGSDTRHNQGSGYGKNLTTDQSDTLMIVHVAASRKWADIMSIPRDSWVNIPPCKMGNGQMSSPKTFKINEAFALGNLYGNHTDLGVACTIKTVERDTGIHIDHFVSINFRGFRDMVNALDGVPECNDKPINDPKSGLHLSAGHHLLNGTQALGYVRARYTLGNGSDLERINRQQAFMASLVNRVKAKLLNPVAIYNFLNAATRSITVDSQFGGVKGLYDLAMSLKKLPPSKVTFFTLPTYPREYVVPSDHANVMWTQPEDSRIFRAFRRDTPVTKTLLHESLASSLTPGQVSVQVLNGTPRTGLQRTVAGVLRQQGFAVAGTGSASSHRVTGTTILYHSGHLAAARLLGSKVSGAGLRRTPGSGATLTLVLGSDYGSTAHTGSSPASPQPQQSFKPRKANQNICTAA